MNYLLFVVYLVPLCWLLLRVPFVKRSGIDGRVLTGLFLFKIAAGIAIGWISLNIYGTGNDYWDVNKEGWIEYQLLISDPGEYFTNIFTSAYPHEYSGMFGSGDSFWNDLKGNIVIKLVSVFNIFSRGDYYINSLFFNFLIFFGHIALYRVFIKIYPGRLIRVIIGCFLLPSMIYFSSGIHKDGLVFLMLAILIYCIFFSLKYRFTIKRLAFIITTLGMLFLLRNFIVFALVPAVFAWVLSVKAKWRPFKSFAVVYVLTGIILFTSGATGFFNPLQIITQKQADYLNLPVSATQIELSTLSPHIKSFVNNVPEAINHAIMRPYVTELPVNSILPLSIELAFYQLLFLLFLFFRQKNTDPANNSFLWFTVFFSFTGLLLIGYISPNLGSLVRYRSLYLPFLITPLICQINWKKIKKIFKLKNNII
ncbi:MAG TPA: hypothetical protein VK489_10375 [Ferruginibacter sp.]|nr:hypothetical protein [Ferruginibacter sp.]